jgi:hypothetical protein
MAGVSVVSATPETSPVIPADDVPSFRSLAPVVAALATIHAGIMLTLALRQHRNFDTYGFDFGIYDQAWWLVGQKGGGFDTVRGLPIWGHHPNLVLWLLAPFARLGLGNWFLVASQTLVLSLGAPSCEARCQEPPHTQRYGDSLRQQTQLPSEKPWIIFLTMPQSLRLASWYRTSRTGKSSTTSQTHFNPTCTGSMPANLLSPRSQIG